MKRLLLFVLTLSLFACELQRQPSLEEISGRWQVYDAEGYPMLVVEFTNEGTFIVQPTKERKPSLWGNFEYSDGVMKMINEGGKYSDRCRDTGNYSLFLSEDLLEFVLVNDECPSRKRSTLSPWQKINQ